MRIAFKSTGLIYPGKIFEGPLEKLRKWTSSGGTVYGFHGSGYWVKPDKLRQVDAKSEQELDRISDRLDVLGNEMTTLRRERYELLQKKFPRFKYTAVRDIPTQVEARDNVN